MYVFVCRQGHRNQTRELSGSCVSCGAPARLVPLYNAIHKKLLVPVARRFRVDHERFLDRAAYIDDAHGRAEQEVGMRLARPRWYNAALARARSKAIERKDDKAVVEASELAKRADRDRPQ